MPESPENLNPVPPAPASRRPTSRGASTRSRRTAGRRPLPDAHAISTFCIPDPAPPYDGAVPAGAQVSAIEPPRAGYGAAFPGPGSTAESAPIAGTWPSQFAQVLSETLAGSRPTSQLVPWTTEQARKRISQLGPMLASGGVPGAPGLPAGRPRGPVAARQPRVRRVIVTSPAQGVLEMTVIVDIGARSRAVAVRLERASTHASNTPKSALPTRATRPGPAAWLCTAVEAA
jgi:hypothetical protein